MFDLDDEEDMERRIDTSAFPTGNWPPKMAERKEVGAFDVNPISWISSAAQGAFGSVQKKAVDEFGNVKVSIGKKKPKKTVPQKVKTVVVQAKEKAVEVSATGEWKTFAFGAGIALGAVGVLKAILK